jgi:hypothetical protein
MSPQRVLFSIFTVPDDNRRSLEEAFVVLVNRHNLSAPIS